MPSLSKGQLITSPRLRTWARKQAFLDVTVRENPYIPHSPLPLQERFLLLNNKEAFYGGAAGGGKSDCLLMAALQYVSVPGYAALVLRRTYAALSKADALLDRANQWLAGTDAVWQDKAKCYVFPTDGQPSRLEFGYLENEKDKYQYQSAAYQFIGFDETTQFLESQYLYLFSRLRRLEGFAVPVRMRSASNPGNEGHDWVKRRFIDPGDPTRPFVPAKMTDNPYIDQTSYTESLANLDPITRAQLLNGDWSARHAGSLFNRSWFEIVDDVPAGMREVRYWDLAATEPRRGHDPDYTTGARVGLKDGIFYVRDMRRDRLTPRRVESLVRTTAELDGHAVAIFIEQEGGASGKSLLDHYAREVLLGFNFRPDSPQGDKVARASAWSSAAEAGNVKLLRGPWLDAFFDEIEQFPNGAHDDQVDVVSGAVRRLSQGRSEFAGIL